MSESFDFDAVDHITVGTVGPPGQRVFYLQARSGDQWLTLKLEKIQVGALADSVQQLLADLPQPGPLPEPEFYELEPAWVIGELGLAYDPPTDRLVLLAQELVFANDEEAESVVERGAMARFSLTREQMAAVAIRGRLLVESGRPPCPVCGYPLEPSGHSCPRLNGHRPPAR